MMRSFLLVTALVAVPFANAQAASFCRADQCQDCVSSITTAGTGYPECVVYDTETVFGGQGFEPGAGGDYLYRVFADIPDPCDGGAGSINIRSPASLTNVGCGDLVFFANNAKCSPALQLEDTFMVQFCCGVEDCDAAGVPWRRSIDIGGHSDRSQASSGLRGAYLTLANGTIIPPIAVGNRPSVTQSKRQCTGYKEESYIPNGEPYLKTFETQIISGTLKASPENDETVTLKYDQSVETSTSFDISIGDPFGIISASVGITFTKSETKEVSYSVTIPAGGSGIAGFTPVFRCTTGTLEDCSGNVTEEKETCTAYVLNGIVQGDYRLIAV